MVALMLKALLLAAFASAANVGYLSKDLKPNLAKAAEIYTILFVGSVRCV